MNLFKPFKMIIFLAVAVGVILLYFIYLVVFSKSGMVGGY